MFRNLVTLVAVLLLITGIASGNSKMGVAGGTELRIPVGTRSTAMAGAVVADVTGSEALFWNPAGAASAMGTEAYFSYRGYFADTYLTYFGVVSSFGYGTVGVHAKILSLGDIYVTTESAWDGTGEIYSVNIPVLGLTYAKAMTDRVSIGATVMYVSEEIMGTSARGMAFDFGFQYVPGWKTLKLGMAMKNYGPRLRYSGPGFEHSVIVPGDDPQASNRILSLEAAAFELPSYFQLGVSYDFNLEQSGILRTGVDFQSNNFSQDEYRLGAEYVIQNRFHLRGGYVYCDQAEYLYGATIGVGVDFNLGQTKGAVNYTHNFISNYFDDVSEVSIAFGF
ncbi:MAG: PorV/PorQ family protein [Candidatus Eisenbacteria bacterium]